MQPDATRLLRELPSFPWFEQVGQRMTTDCVRVDSWEEAAASAQSEVWRSVQLEVRNNLSYRVNRLNYERFVQWNTVTSEINCQIEFTLKKVLESFSSKMKIGRWFVDSVLWDMMLSCQEAEFADVYPPVFFLERVLPLYRAGYFPCGWSGSKLLPGWEDPMPPGRIVCW
jgi:hypothetical protein